MKVLYISLLSFICSIQVTIGFLQTSLSCGAGTLGPIYSTSLDGNDLFSNSPSLAVFMNGAWTKNSWVITSAANVSGSDALGVY